jgi:hypothetical protein
MKFLYNLYKISHDVFNSNILEHMPCIVAGQTWIGTGYVSLMQIDASLTV